MEAITIATSAPSVPATVSPVMCEPGAGATTSSRSEPRSWPPTMPRVVRNAPIRGTRNAARPMNTQPSGPLRYIHHVPGGGARPPEATAVTPVSTASRATPATKFTSVAGIGLP